MITSAMEIIPNGSVWPVSSCRFTDQFLTQKVKIKPRMKATNTQSEPSSNIGDGSLTPRLFKKIESPIDKLWRTFGRASKITHQKILT